MENKTYITECEEEGNKDSLEGMIESDPVHFNFFQSNVP